MPNGRRMSVVEIHVIICRPHPKVRECNIFSLFTGRYPIQPTGVGTPSSRWGGGGVTPSSQLGSTLARSVWGTPSPFPHGRQSSRASTCYAAGSMPLVFTQEDFLVLIFFIQIYDFYLFNLVYKIVL